MIKSKMNDTENVLNQYKTGKNLSTRISLYEKYSINQQTYTDWIYENYKFFDLCEVLEFGSGTGKDWKGKINKLPQNCNLILSDFSQGMVEELKLKFVEHKNISVMELDIQNAQIEDNSKDFIIANSMLYHVPDIDKAISEVSRILKGNGTFYAATAGSKSMFQYLRETLLKIDPRITMPEAISFNLQSGRVYLEKYFNQVKIAKYENRLKIVDTNDLVNFIYSVSSIEGLEECDRDKVLEYYENKRNSNGFITIDIEYGMFIAKK